MAAKLKYVPWLRSEGSGTMMLACFAGTLTCITIVDRGIVSIGAWSGAAVESSAVAVMVEPSAALPWLFMLFFST
jgi:hypothetical protein